MQRCELKVKNSATPVPELAEAYGDMGKLLMATEYLDAAEVCFANARELAPGEMRWPYCLGHVHRFRQISPSQAAELFEQALRLKPEDVAALVWLGDMQLAQSRPEAAAAPLEKALQKKNGLRREDGSGRGALARRRIRPSSESAWKERWRSARERSRIRYPLAIALWKSSAIGSKRNPTSPSGDAELTWPNPLMEEVAGLLQNAAAYGASEGARRAGQAGLAQSGHAVAKSD